VSEISVRRGQQAACISERRRKAVEAIEDAIARGLDPGEVTLVKRLASPGGCSGSEGRKNLPLAHFQRAMMMDVDRAAKAMRDEEMLAAIEDFQPKSLDHFVPGRKGPAAVKGSWTVCRLKWECQSRSAEIWTQYGRLSRKGKIRGYLQI
jgi:hypothetical protein